MVNVAQGSEPWIDVDPAEAPKRYEIGAVGVRASAEYRAQATFIDPIALNSESQRRANWIEQRARVTAAVDYREKIHLNVSMDILDGVLWGDNGTFGGEPSSVSGMNTTAKNPNFATRCIGLINDQRDPLTADAYGFSLCPADMLRIRRLYAQVNTPLGVLRVGRQPVAIGMAVQTASGDGRTNRFGVNGVGNMVAAMLCL